MSIVIEELGEATGFETIAPSGKVGITSTLITPSSGSWKNVGAEAAEITVETYPIRYNYDDTVSTTVGHKLDPGQSYTIIGKSNVANWRCRSTAAGTSSISVTVFHKTR